MQITRNDFKTEKCNAQSILFKIPANSPYKKNWKIMQVV